MNCNRCNKEGAKPYKYTDNGNCYTIYLCDGCFAEVNAPAPQEEEKRSGILGMERRCQSCGRSLKEIRRTGYLGCADCFLSFKNELIQLIDKYQNKVISSPEKKQRELAIILLEDEYTDLLAKGARSQAEIPSVSRRLRQIEEQLLQLGVRVDG